MLKSVLRTLAGVLLAFLLLVVIFDVLVALFVCLIIAIWIYALEPGEPIKLDGLCETFLLRVEQHIDTALAVVVIGFNTLFGRHFTIKTDYINMLRKGDLSEKKSARARKTVPSVVESEHINQVEVDSSDFNPKK